MEKELPLNQSSFYFKNHNPIDQDFIDRKNKIDSLVIETQVKTAILNNEEDLKKPKYHDWNREIIEKNLGHSKPHPHFHLEQDKLAAQEPAKDDHNVIAEKDKKQRPVILSKATMQARMQIRSQSHQRMEQQQQNAKKIKEYFFDRDKEKI